MLKATFKRHEEYPLIWRYVFAVALVLLSLLVTESLWSTLHEIPMVIFFAAITLSAWVGGMGPGLLATVLSIVLSDYFLFPPLGVLLATTADIIQFFIFGAVATIISATNHARLHALVEAQQTRGEMHILMDNVADAITAQDATGKVVFANQAAARLTGFDSVEQLMSATVRDIQARYELLDEEGEPFPYEKLPRGRVFAQNVTAEARFRMRFLADGHERWIHLTSAPVPGRDGKARLAVNIFRDVTETMQQQARLRQLLDNLPALVGMTTPDGILIEANRVALDLAGLEREDVVNKPFDQTYWWAYDEAVQAQLRDAIARAARGERIRYDVKVRTGESTFAIIDFILAPIFDENGRVSALLPSAVDVTERKQYEADRERLTLLLMQEQTRLKGIIANMPGVVWEIMADEYGKPQVTFISDYAEELFGYPTGHWVEDPNSFVNIIHEDDRERALAEMQGISNPQFQMQYRIRTKDGTTKHIESRTRLVENAVTRQPMLIGITSDVTAYKKAEAQLIYLNAQLDDERSRLDAILASVPGIVWEGVGKPDGYQRLTYVSPQVETILGYSREYWLDNANLWQEIIVADDLPKAFDQAMALFEKERPGSVEFRLVAKDGRIVPVEARMTVMPHDAHDGERHMCGVIMDISERKRSERRVANYAERLRRSNEELKQFAYVASHDLQEPLRMVSSYLQLLENRYSDQLDQDAKEFIGFAVDGATRMKQLIQDLLLYSRVETRKGAFSMVDMNQVLDAVKRDLGVLIQETGATVTSGDLPVLTADQLQMTQLLQNLINNAIKFRSEEPPCVEISAEKVSDLWKFTVRDNGIGIEEKYKDRIFEIFQRLHGRGKYPGTGIGLAICRRVVERHGGRIWVESEAGHGSNFYFAISSTLTQEQGDSNAEE
ncbi:MAG: PAS domain S-box protein [Anaerolineae bacterium]|nr:PAS domain S-box protein [Anaerolineae bacterium]